ncbi:MAG: HNH endonuclease [Bifidobacteriaceae bacterium]|nr:HNH endonuclease [Bifidobacteriaceae bacterium]
MAAQVKAKRATAKELKDPALRKAVWLRDSLDPANPVEGLCRYCGRIVKQKATAGPSRPALDHVAPTAALGLRNLVLACLACNQQKGQRTPAEAGMALRPAPRPSDGLPDPLRDGAERLAAEASPKAPASGLMHAGGPSPSAANPPRGAPSSAGDDPPSRAPGGRPPTGACPAAPGPTRAGGPSLSAANPPPGAPSSAGDDPPSRAPGGPRKAVGGPSPPLGRPLANPPGNSVSAGQGASVVELSSRARDQAGRLAGVGTGSGEGKACPGPGGGEPGGAGRGAGRGRRRRARRRGRGGPAGLGGAGRAAAAPAAPDPEPPAQTRSGSRPRGPEPLVPLPAGRFGSPWHGRRPPGLDAAAGVCERHGLDEPCRRCLAESLGGA